MAKQTQDDVWNEAIRSEYIQFKDVELDITFVDGTINTKAGIGGATSYEFDVILNDDSEQVSKMLGTQSKGLLRGLSEYLPLAGKRFGITRTGEGFGIVYAVREL